ncbi:hypothetical protein FKM82_024642 [Ascaphus truei]
MNTTATTCCATCVALRSLSLRLGNLGYMHVIHLWVQRLHLGGIPTEWEEALTGKNHTKRANIKQDWLYCIAKHIITHIT